MEYYNLPIKDVFEKLKSSEEGLSKEEAQNRLKEHGPNIIEESEKISPLKIFFNQFKNAMVIILIAALFVSIVLLPLIPETKLALERLSPSGIHLSSIIPMI